MRRSRDFDECEIQLCQQDRPDGQRYCYYHQKVADGLTTTPAMTAQGSIRRR